MGLFVFFTGVTPVTVARLYTDPDLRSDSRVVISSSFGRIKAKEYSRFFSNGKPCTEGPADRSGFCSWPWSFKSKFDRGIRGTFSVNGTVGQGRVMLRGSDLVVSRFGDVMWTGRASTLQYSRVGFQVEIGAICMCFKGWFPPRSKLIRAVIESSGLRWDGDARDGFR